MGVSIQPIGINSQSVRIMLNLVNVFLQPSGEGPLSDKPNYVNLLKSFSSLLRPLGLMLTSEGTINKAIVAKGGSFHDVRLYKFDCLILFSRD
jgi:hypothetical protein